MCHLQTHCMNIYTQCTHAAINTEYGWGPVPSSTQNGPGARGQFLHITHTKRILAASVSEHYMSYMCSGATMSYSDMKSEFRKHQRWWTIWWLRSMYYLNRPLLNSSAVSSEWCKPWSDLYLGFRENGIFTKENTCCSGLQRHLIWSATESLHTCSAFNYGPSNHHEHSMETNYTMFRSFFPLLWHSRVECWTASHNIWFFVVFSWQM